MDIDQLRTFDRIARDLSFTRAAARLNVTQATVSMRIRVLEDQLGVQLFSRGRKIALTDQGLTFLPYARRILAAAQDGREAMRRVERGRVVIGALRSMVGSLTTDSYLRFQKRHPDIDVVIHEGRHEHIVAMLHERVATLGILCWPNLDPLGSELAALTVVREPVPLVMAPALAARLPENPDIADVLKIAPRLVSLRWWQVEPEAATSLALRAHASVELPTEPGRQLVLRGAGLGLFVRSAVADELKSGALVEVRPRNFAPLHRDIALVATSLSALDNENIRAFASEIASDFSRVGRVLENQITAILQ